MTRTYCDENALFPCKKDHNRIKVELTMTKKEQKWAYKKFVKVRDHYSNDGTPLNSRISIKVPLRS